MRKYRIDVYAPRSKYVAAGRWNRWPLGLSLESLEISGCDAFDERRHWWWNSSGGSLLLVSLRLVPWKNKNKNKRFLYMTSSSMSNTARRTDSPYLQNVVSYTHYTWVVRYTIWIPSTVPRFDQHSSQWSQSGLSVRLSKSSIHACMHAHFPSSMWSSQTGVCLVFERVTRR